MNPQQIESVARRMAQIDGHNPDYQVSDYHPMVVNGRQVIVGGTAGIETRPLWMLYTVAASIALAAIAESGTGQ